MVISLWLFSLLIITALNSSVNVEFISTMDKKMSLEYEELHLAKVLEEFNLLRKSNSFSSLTLESTSLDEKITNEKIRVGQIKSILVKANDPEFRVLEALSNVPSRDTWVTQIAKNKGFITINGKAMSSTAAPIWLEELKADPFFKKLKYKGISISSNIDLTFNFVIRFQI